MNAADITPAVAAGYSLAAIEAAQQFLDRRDRREHPAGRFDRQGRFELNADERCDCCAGVRSPSRAYPYPEMTHARTAEHCAALHGADAAEVRRLARWLDAKPAAPAATATAHEVIAARRAVEAWLLTIKPTAARAAEIRAAKAAERAAARAEAADPARIRRAAARLAA